MCVHVRVRVCVLACICMYASMCACVCTGAEKFVDMPREEKRKLYKCGKKYTTLEGISTLKEDIESGSNESTHPHLVVMRVTV